MKKDIIDIVCCPICKSNLILKIEKEEKGEIVKGVFTCKKCSCDYEIIDGIANLMPK